LALASLHIPARAEAEQLFLTRSRGQEIRALILPAVGPPKGGIVLLSGGPGKLEISATGKLARANDNSIVRNRAAFARAGYLTLVPDVAPDFVYGDDINEPVRWSAQWAEDVGAHISAVRAELAKLGATGRATQVHLVGTSRAALTVTKAALQLTAAARPDTITLSAAAIVDVRPDRASAERVVGNLHRISQPIHLVHHVDDGCAITPASAVPRAKALFKGAASVTVTMLRGGRAGSGNPCRANSHHGFLGQDQEMVDVVTRWLAAPPP
jgi:dienelactone hydrolase